MRWLHVPPDIDISSTAEFVQNDEWAARTIRQLQSRATSSLINVGLIGEFSSGKSFLVGGLQGRLEYAPVTNDDGMTSDQYIGILHSASKASTACPASVVPVRDETGVDASANGFYRVRFTDSERWEEIGNSPVPAVVAAYTTADPKAIARGRPAPHRGRTVAEVEILLGEPVLPAKLYDLPGTGSPHPIHDEIANNAWADADCFIYVTQAAHTLSQTDLELIKRLYVHHINSGKRVLWVMTGIDRAAMANYDGEPEWKDAVEVNNNYLRENFPPPAGSPDSFVGPDGFMPVSPAWEALGKWQTQQGNQAQGERLIAASRMRRLRRALTDLIESGTGHKHLKTVATEAYTLLEPRYRVLNEILESSRLPLEQLGAERDSLSRRIGHLRSAIDAVREQLEGALRDHLRRTERTFSGIHGYIHGHLDEQIKRSDLTKAKEANSIEVKKAQTFKRYVASEGPIQTWESEFSSFASGALSSVRATLRDAASEVTQDTIDHSIDLDDLMIPPAQKYRSGSKDVMQKITGFIGLSTPVASAVALALGLVSGPLLVVPAAVTLLAGIAYGTVRKSAAKRTALDALRQEWINGLDEAAKAYEGAFLAAAGVKGMSVVDRAIELLSERRDELSRRVILVETRLADPEVIDRTALVEMLGPYCATGREIITELQNVARH